MPKKADFESAAQPDIGSLIDQAEMARRREMRRRAKALLRRASLPMKSVSRVAGKRLKAFGSSLTRQV